MYRHGCCCISDSEQSLIEALEEQIDFDNIRGEIVYKEDIQRTGDPVYPLPTIAENPQVYESEM